MFRCKRFPQDLNPSCFPDSFAITALLAVAIWWASGRAGLSSAQRAAAWLVAMAVLVSWQLLGERLARAGVLINQPDRLGPWMGVAVVLPVIIGLAGIAASPTARRIVEATPLWALVAIQFYRVLGADSLSCGPAAICLARLRCPPVSAMSPLGLAAPFIGYTIARWPNKPSNVAWWNAFGIADLVIAVTTGFLTSPGAAKTLALDAPNQFDHRVSSGSGAALRSAGLVDLARPSLATARRSHYRCHSRRDRLRATISPRPLRSESDRVAASPRIVAKAGMEALRVALNC